MEADEKLLSLWLPWYCLFSSHPWSLRKSENLACKAIKKQNTDFFFSLAYQTSVRSENSDFFQWNEQDVLFSGLLCFIWVFPWTEVSLNKGTLCPG